MLWSPNLQLYYPLENSANDFSGNARHGTLGGTPPCTYATKPNGGRCLYFPGTGYVETPSFGLSGTVVVFACWVRCATYGTLQGIIGAAGGSVANGVLFFLRSGNSANVGWQYSDGTNIINANCANYFADPWNDVWLPMVVVCDYAGKRCYFYRNATLFASPALTGSPVFPASDGVKYVGKLHSGYPLTAGYLANVQLWTLATMPPVAVLTANANRLMLGMNPIWSV
jgi:hypothetical protein